MWCLDALKIPVYTTCTEAEAEAEADADAEADQ